MKRLSKIFVFILSLCMIPAFAPNAVYAEETEQYAVYNDADHTLTFCVGVLTEDGVVRDGTPALVSGVRYEPLPVDASNHPGYSDREEITKVVFLDTIETTYTKGWFDGYENLTEIVGLDKLNTEHVTTMEGMFYHCSSLTSVDLSHFNTSNVVYMDCMFTGCSSLKNLDVSSFDTGKVEYMSEMFGGCSALTSLDLSGFNTENVESIAAMFDDCSSLTSLDLSSFNTEKVENMAALFAGCENLTSLDIRSFDTGNVEAMTVMFVGCSSLTSLDLSHFRTEKVKDMYAMFAGCEKLEHIDVGSFDFSSAENIKGMFAYCPALTTLDLRNFNIPKSVHMGGLFVLSDALSTLQLGEDFRFTFLDEGLDENFEVDISTPGLTEPPQDETYTGYWVKDSGDGTRYTATQLMKLYDGATMAGTWVWEKKTSIAGISGATVTGEPQTYAGKALTTTVTVTLDGTVLTEGTDYEITGYKNNTDAGTATVTVTGKGLYKDSVSGTFSILPAGLAGAFVTVDPQTYSGVAVTPSVAVRLGENLLTEGLDYTVTYDNNEHAGTATAHVNGIGNYKGDVSASFTISPGNLAGAEVTVADQLYTGKALKPEVTVVSDGKTLIAGTDYTVEYLNNTGPTSDAVVLVNGKGDYIGTVYGTFLIKTEDGVDFLLGDVDGNGKVEAADARYALRAAVGLDDTAEGLDFSKKTNRCFLAADVTKDQTILAEDARLILRAAVGLESLT